MHFSRVGKGKRGFDLSVLVMDGIGGEAKHARSRREWEGEGGKGGE